jgi:hypothetical protein
MAPAIVPAAPGDVKGARLRSAPVRSLRLLLLLGLVGLVLWLARQLGSSRAPRADLSHGPVVGSLDTWPEVPRAPQDGARA